MSGFLEELPYILRRHTLRDEMSAVEEQSLLFKKASRKREDFAFTNILAVVTSNRLGMKVMRTAIDFAVEFGAELSFISPAGFSDEMFSHLKSCGVPHTILPKAHTIDRDVIFFVKKHGFDLVIVPEKFRDRLKKMSVATSQIVKGVRCPVMVIK